MAEGRRKMTREQEEKELLSQFLSSPSSPGAEDLAAEPSVVDEKNALLAQFLSGDPAPSEEPVLKEPPPPAEKSTQYRDRLELGLSDAMTTMMGDTYGRATDDPTEKYDWLGPDINSPEKLMASGANVLAGVGDVVGDAVSEAVPEPIKRGLSSAIAKINENRAAHPVYSQASLGEVSADIEEAHPRLHAAASDAATVASGVLPMTMGRTKVGANIAQRNLDAKNKLRDVDIAKRWQPTDIEKARGRITTHRLGRDTYDPIDFEKQMYRDLADIDDLDPRAPYKKNYNSIEDEGERLRKELDERLLYEDQVPFNDVVDDVSGALKDITSSASLKGDAKKLATDIYDEFRTRLDDLNESGSVRPGALLQLRRDIDRYVTGGKKTAFDAEVVNAQQIALKAIRDRINDVVIKNTPDAKTRESLRRQSSLLSARDDILPYAKTESDNPFGRAVQRTQQRTGFALPHSAAAVEANVQAMPLAIGSLMAAYSNLGRGVKSTGRVGRLGLEKALGEGYQAGRGPLTLAAFQALKDEEEENQ
jgi:hypothetical protein